MPEGRPSPNASKHCKGRASEGIADVVREDIRNENGISHGKTYLAFCLASAVMLPAKGIQLGENHEYT